jgi:hypothetical protein
MKDALAPFRRIWIEEENANFCRAAKIVAKHSSNKQRCFCAQLQRALYNSHRRAMTQQGELTNKDIIDLWLYTQLAHCQTNRKKGRFTRQDFDNFVQRMGRPYLEYLFRKAVKLLGAHFLILYYDAALPEFEEWITVRGVSLPFKAKNAFGTDENEVSEDGVVIDRAPYKFISNEIPGQKLARLLERDKFHILRFELKTMLGLGWDVAALNRYQAAYERIQTHDSFTAFFTSLGYSEGRGDPSTACAHQSFTAMPSLKAAVTHIYRDKHIEFKGAAREVLEQLYVEFRATLLNDQSDSTFAHLLNSLSSEKSRHRSP